MQQAIESLAEQINAMFRPDTILVPPRWFTTDPADMSDVLTLEEFNVFICHSIRQHVMYYEEDAEGRKHYECLECVRHQGHAGSEGVR